MKQTVEQRMSSALTGILFMIGNYWMVRIFGRLLGSLTVSFPVATYGELITIFFLALGINLFFGGAFNFFSWALGYPKSVFK